jgi:aminocarboxymuconate-semialdehyde decarboxylase
MITDIHRHFVPEEFLQFVLARNEFGIRITGREGEAADFEFRGLPAALNATFFDLNRQIVRMRHEGVERAILSLATPFINYWLEPGLAVQSARLFNDSLAAAIASNRTSFGGWAMLPMQDPQAASEELRRAVQEYGFAGGHVASNVRGIYLNDDQFEPVFKTALELNVPLLVHPADPLGKDRTGDYELTIVAGYLFDSTVNILKMICSGFLDRWPNLKLVFAHAGAFSTILRARMQREADTNSQLQKTLQKPIGDYLRCLYFDTICFESAILRYVAEAVPPGHLLLGSDAPFPLGEPDPVGFVRKSLPADKAEVILHESFDGLLEA